MGRCSSPFESTYANCVERSFSRSFASTVTVSPSDSPEGPSSIPFHRRSPAVNRMKRGRSDEGSRHTPIIADGIGSPWPAASYQPFPTAVAAAVTVYRPSARPQTARREQSAIRAGHPTRGLSNSGTSYRGDVRQGTPLGPRSASVRPSRPPFACFGLGGPGSLGRQDLHWDRSRHNCPFSLSAVWCLARGWKPHLGRDS